MHVSFAHTTDSMNIDTEKEFVFFSLSVDSRWFIEFYLMTRPVAGSSKCCFYFFFSEWDLLFQFKEWRRLLGKKSVEYPIVSRHFQRFMIGGGDFVQQSIQAFWRFCFGKSRVSRSEILASFKNFAKMFGICRHRIVWNRF